MKALKYLGPGSIGFQEVPIPQPGPGEVLIKVTACGVCHTDVSFRKNPSQALPIGLTLGHEIAGIVEKSGPGTRGFPIGTPVIVYTVWSCGECRQCVSGRQNACLHTGGRLKPAGGPGTQYDGGMAEYVVVPQRALIEATDISSAAAAVLPDAAIVPYHSIRAAADLLTPGSSALVIGIGGLGQYAVSILSALHEAKIIAVDVRDEVLERVAGVADFTLNSGVGDVREEIFKAAGEYGPDFVLDLVGSTETLELATSVVAPYGTVRVPGQSYGVFQFETDRASTAIPRGATINRPYSGTYQDLIEVVELARAGRIGVDIEEYAFDDALEAFDALEAGKILGRAVLVMENS